MSRFFHHLRPRSIVLPVVLLFAGGAHAQDNATPAALTLTAALNRAAERNPTLLTQGYHERAADALIEQAGLRPNPTLDVSLENFAGTGAVRGDRALEATVQASQTIERGGKRDKRVALASREREAAAREYAVRRNEVLSETAVAYLQTIAAQQRLELAAEPLRLARETVTAVEARVKAGAASPAESARARAGLATAEAEVARVQSALNAARAALAATWGGDADEVPALTAALRLPDTLPDRDALLSRLPDNPRLELQQSLIAGRRAALELERAQAAQDYTVGGGVRFLRDGSDAAFVAGVSIPIPFRNRNQGNIRAARETLAGTEQGAQAVEVELRSAFAAAWQELSAAHQTFRNLSTQALPATRDAYDAVRHAYDQGQLPLIDVLDAQRALVAIRRDMLDAQSDYALAQARLDAITDPAYAAVSSLISQP